MDNADNVIFTDRWRSGINGLNHLLRMASKNGFHHRMTSISELDYSIIE